MLRGQVAIVLSCSDKFKATLAWPVRDALTSQGLGVIIVSDEPPLPSFRGDVDDRGAKGNFEAYLDASSAFVALCAADYELSDGSKYPRASLIDEIQLALTRPHLQGRCQVLKSPGVLLPSDISPTYLSLDAAKPAEAADVILKQFQEWEVALQPPGPSAAPHRPAAEAADDVDALFDGLNPGELGEARQRIYALLRDRGEDRRRWVTRELHRELTESDDHTRQVAAMSLPRRPPGSTSRWSRQKWSSRWPLIPGTWPARARRTFSWTGRPWPRSTSRWKYWAGWPRPVPTTGWSGRPRWPRFKDWSCGGTTRT